MSVLLSTAFYKRLAGIEVIDPSLYNSAKTAQATLATLLGFDSRLNGGAGSPSIYKGNESKGVIKPCVTFRYNGGADAPLPRVESGIIEQVYLDLEIWDNQEGGDLIDPIASCIEILIDNRTGLAPPIIYPNNAGRIFWGQAFVPLSDQFDNGSEDFFSIWRFQFLEARTYPRT